MYIFGDVNTSGLISGHIIISGYLLYSCCNRRRILFRRRLFYTPFQFVDRYYSGFPVSRGINVRLLLLLLLLLVLLLICRSNFDAI